VVTRSRSSRNTQAPGPRVGARKQGAFKGWGRDKNNLLKGGDEKTAGHRGGPFSIKLNTERGRKWAAPPARPPGELGRAVSLKKRQGEAF